MAANDGEVEIEYVDMDEYIKHVGEFGRYQLLILFLIIIGTFPLVFPVLIFYYIGHGPKWKCNPNTIEDFTSLCTSNTSVYESTNATRCDMNRTHWIYEDLGKSTIVTEFDLVCNRSWLDALTGSVVFIGWGIGIIIMGYLSDRYGRKRVMYPCLQLSLVCLLMHAFVYDIWVLIVLRFFMGFLFSGPALNQFIMIMELVGSKYRVIATTITSFVWPGAAFVLTLKAYYIESWRILCLMCSAPYLLGFLTMICVPESVRWLNQKGRQNEAETILKRVARMNKKKLPPFLALQFQESEGTNTVSYLDLFKKCGIAQLVVLQGFMWFHVGMTYYTINWEFADIGGDMYINSILSFVVELPGNFITLYTLQKFGRKKTTFSFAACTAFACFVIACIPKVESLETLRITFGLLGKGAASCMFICIYLWSSEIYSTVARTQGMAINIVTSRAGAACSPFINQLDQLHPAGPFILMTITSVMATIVCAILPETLNTPTRETLNDMMTHPNAIQIHNVSNFNTDDFHTGGDTSTNNQSAPYSTLVNETNGDDENNDELTTSTHDQQDQEVNYV